jgi:thioredoxin-related protein
MMLTLAVLASCQPSDTIRSTEITKPETVPAKALSTTPKTFQWALDFDRALAAARDAKKIVMVDVYTDWCGWCKKLDRDTYSNKTVQEKVIKDFIAVKINPEKSQKYAQLAREFGTRGYPHIVFLDSTGKKIHEIGGYQPANQFSQELEAVVKKAGK